MRITNKMMMDNTMRYLQQSMQRMDRLHEQLATGRKFTRPSQDPAGTFSSMWVRTEMEINDQLLRNTETGLGWLETTDKALDGLGAMMQRTRELMVYSANGVHDESSAEAIMSEIKQIREGLIELSNIRYGDRYIFGGTQTQTPPFTVVEGEAVRTADFGDEEHGLHGIKGNAMAAGDYSVQLNRLEDGAPPQWTLFQESQEALFGADLNIPDDQDHNVSLHVEIAGQNWEWQNLIEDGLQVASRAEGVDLSIAQAQDGEEAGVNIVQDEDTGRFQVNILFEEGDTAQDIYTLISQHEAGPREALDAGDLLAFQLVDGDVLPGDEIVSGQTVQWDTDHLISQDLKVQAHIYDREGNYTYYEDMVLGHGPGEALNIDLMDGDELLSTIGVNIDPQWTGFREGEDGEFYSIKEGDSAAYSILPQQIDGETYNLLELQSGEGTQGWLFQEGTFNDGSTSLHLFTVDDDEERDSLSTGKDGTFTVSISKFLPGVEAGEGPVQGADFTYRVGASYQGDERTISVRLAPGVNIPINLNGREVFSGFFELLGNFEEDLANMDLANISGNRLQEMDDVFDDFLTQRTFIGAQMLRLDLTKNRLVNQEVELSKNLEGIEGVDLAKTISFLKMEETIYRSALASGARILQPTLMDFLR